ncbi:MAG: peptidoglycan-binding protein, partial [Acidimicrobiia bacterium]
DVEQLEQALVDLGYDPNRNMTINEDFTSATADAIERLQEDIGADEDGALNFGEVIFMPDAFYVAEPLVDIGTAVGSGTPIVAMSSAIDGTVTTIIDEGSIAGLGEELMTIDGEPVVLLIGDVPVFRAMGLGVSGADVLQLEAALAELGYGGADDFSTDGVFDEATRLAVVAWQSAIGAKPDGVVNVGDVIFLPNPIRVGDNLVAVGDVVHDGTPIMSTSVSATFVTVELSTDDQDLVAVGDAVVVVLPNGTREPASVTEIGTVVQANQGGDTFFEMTVTLDDPDAAPGLDEAPVDVEIIGDSASNVLAVPVTALIALAEGGYAVEIVAEDGTTFLVAVDPGLFADGTVEVASDGLQAGHLVVIP